jgi:hypothetical protein
VWPIRAIDNEQAVSSRRFLYQSQLTPGDLPAEPSNGEDWRPPGSPPTAVAASLPEQRTRPHGAISAIPLSSLCWSPLMRSAHCPATRISDVMQRQDSGNDTLQRLPGPALPRLFPSVLPLLPITATYQESRFPRAAVTEGCLGGLLLATELYIQP